VFCSSQHMHSAELYFKLLSCLCAPAVVGKK